jgi:branched-subunit amino acid transport protein
VCAMSELWAALVIAALGCYALKLAGVSVPASALRHPRVRRVARLLPVAMLSALVVVELVDDGGRYGWDWTTLAGVAAGLLALLLEQGVLVVFTVAVVVTALLRLVA